MIGRGKYEFVDEYKVLEKSGLVKRTKAKTHAGSWHYSGLPNGIGKKGNRVSRKHKHEPECTRKPLLTSSYISNFH